MTDLTIHDLKQIALSRDITLHTLLGLLDILIHDEKIENKILIQKTGIPKEHMGRILKDLTNILEPPSPFVILKKEMKPQIATLLSEFFKTPSSELHALLQATAQDLIQSRPQAKREYDQFLATKETLVKRAEYLFSQGDLLDRKILFLGDDDHTSHMIRALSTDIDVTVLDIDSDILHSITQFAHTHHFQVHTELHDIRNPIPDNFKQTFDVVFTDPPYTEAGVDLFINTGIQALKKSPTSKLYFCYGTSDRARERELRIQGILVKKGLLLRDKLHAFNTYEGAESIGGKSSLYQCVLTPQTKTTSALHKDIYTNQ